MTKSFELQKINQEIISCYKCERLVAWREEVARLKRKAYRDQQYWGRGVPGFGDPHARVLVVGLAPGAHGSNRTGRVFTGDASGAFLFPSLYRAGFASQPNATSKDDGLILKDLYIAAVAHCVPPANKPLPIELDNCQPYLERTIRALQPKVIVCLGRIAFERITRLYSVRNPAWKFGHGAFYSLNTDSLNTGPWILCSYHPSQQNTLTGRLTSAMFDEVWTKARSLIE
jgi:uracil-DNA glycosylase family 4